MVKGSVCCAAMHLEQQLCLNTSCALCASAHPQYASKQAGMNARKPEPFAFAAGHAGRLQLRSAGAAAVGPAAAGAASRQLGRAAGRQRDSTACDAATVYGAACSGACSDGHRTRF